MVKSNTRSNPEGAVATVRVSAWVEMVLLSKAPPRKLPVMVGAASCTANALLVTVTPFCDCAVAVMVTELEAVAHFT